MFQHAGRCRAGLAFDADIVLHRAGNARQIGNGLARGDLRIHSGRSRESLLITRGKVRMDLAFCRVAVRDDLLCQFDRGDLLRGQLLMEIVNGHGIHSPSSLYDLRHFEVAVFFFRRVQKRFFIGKRFMRHIFAHDIVLLHRVDRTFWTSSVDIFT